MLLYYRDHRAWLWFTLLATAFATGVYWGTLAPPRPDYPFLMTGIGILGGTLLFRWCLGRFVRMSTTPRLGLGAGVAAGGFLIGLALGRNWASPVGPTGSSVTGLWFGIMGSLCMLFAGGLAGLRRVPAWWWIGSRQWWLKGHLWLGVLSGLLIAFHANFRLGGLLEMALWAVLLFVIGSGIFGLLLQNVVPRMLTLRVPHEIPYEQIPHEVQVLRRQSDTLVDELCGSEVPTDLDASLVGDPRTDAAGRAALRHAYETVIRPFFDTEYRLSSPLARSAQAPQVFASLLAVPGLAGLTEEIARLQRFCDDRRQMGEQERLHHWLHMWLLLHIPLSALLLGLSLAHIVTALYY